MLPTPSLIRNDGLPPSVPAFFSLLTLAACLSGCGASSLRVGAGPITDSDGRVGFESTVSLGIGMPLDYSGQSHHFLQGLGYIGGGTGSEQGSGTFTTGAGLDYIYWAHPRVDIRAGLQFVYRNHGEEPRDVDLLGVGAHLALLPVVISSDSSWMLLQFCVGPEFRVDQSWNARGGSSRGHLAVPLVAEFNLLATGD